ncbi:MAG: DUF1194 domain-containing protein [Flavobacteriaceae bacterium]
MRRAAALSALVLLLLLAAPGDNRAARQDEVDLRLVFAVDSSYSVNVSEFALQQRGMALALRDPEVMEAIAAGRHRRIALTVIQWAHFDSQQTVLPWTVIETPAEADAAAAILERQGRAAVVGTTSMSGAIRAGIEALAETTSLGGRAVIDLAADGTNNSGPDVEIYRDLAVSLGVTVNGLAILNEVIYLHHYMRNHMIGGPGAFVEVASDYKDFAEAFKRKLIREIRGNFVS